jgi:hypothetical protein
MGPKHHTPCHTGPIMQPHASHLLCPNGSRIPAGCPSKTLQHCLIPLLLLGSASCTEPACTHTHTRTTSTSTLPHGAHPTPVPTPPALSLAGHAHTCATFRTCARSPAALQDSHQVRAAAHTHTEGSMACVCCAPTFPMLPTPTQKAAWRAYAVHPHSQCCPHPHRRQHGGVCCAPAFSMAPACWQSLAAPLGPIDGALQHHRAVQQPPVVAPPARVRTALRQLASTPIHHFPHTLCMLTMSTSFVAGPQQDCPNWDPLTKRRPIRSEGHTPPKAHKA